MRHLPILALLLAPAIATGAEKADYTRDIAPILQRYCAGCHQADDAEGGFAMDTYQLVMKGGDSGLAVTGGSASSSRLLLMATGKLKPVMPPEGEEQPTEAELERLTAWVEQGAIGPDGDMPIKHELRPMPKVEEVTEPAIA